MFFTGMMLSMRRSFLLYLLCLTCAACGWQPVYGVNKYQTTSVETYLQATQISNIPDHEGQYLRNLLIDRFHRNKNPAVIAYTLEIDPIQESSRDLDITKTSDSTRAQLRLVTNMVLRDERRDEVVLSQPLTAIVSYNTLASEFSTRVSENNARENGLYELANQIENRVSLYFKRNSGARP